jgi:archaetidylinositol phosphate synthase
MREAQRELTFLLAGPERRVLRALAARLPHALHSDHLTALGVLGALGAATAYALSRSSPGWLWVASACLVVQWLGDSLDGTLARVRRAERPRYGYYLDHVVDAGATAAIGLGLGLSPYCDLGIALGAVIAYLALSINLYLEAQVFSVFKLGYGRLGPTEVRLVMIVANAVLVTCRPGPSVHLIASATLAALAVGMIALLGVRVARNLVRLSREEPRPPALPLRARLRDPRGSLAPS